MRTTGVIACVGIALAMPFLLWGCGKPDDQTTEETGTDSVQSKPLAENSEQQTATSPVSDAASTTAQTGGDIGQLDKQIKEVRAAFLSLQQICKANNIDGYAAFWDDKTKEQIDGRDLTVAQRQERRRQRLLEKPGDLQEIAKATIESIEVNTSQAEKLESFHGQKVEGTMIVVFTDGPALLFHETADGWKLFTLSTGDYFRQK
ncbi:MAG: hypothetical protein GXY19_09625 [Phycisphaerae bacterium]|nr:hypothetical protein [Phycisphaerae bacterium]